LPRRNERETAGVHDLRMRKIVEVAEYLVGCGLVLGYLVRATRRH
jgi:hypothetical protein